MAMDSKRLSRAGGVALTAIGIGAGFWVSLVLADVLTFVWVFFDIDNKLEGYGVNEYGSKIAAAIFAALIAWFANTILLRIIKRDKKWVPIVAVLMVAWFAVMYVVSSPYNGSPFNPFNGKAQDYYRDQYGVIHSIGRGAEIGPHGETVQPFDKEAAQEYERQSGKPNLNFLERWLGNSSDDITLHVDVEQVEIFPDKTILHFAVRRTDNSRLGRFYQPQGWNYLSDETGQTYNLTNDNATYPDWVDANSHKDFDNSDKPHAETHIVRPDEVYRFTTEYAPLKSNINHLRLHDSRFGQVDLDYLLAQGQVAAQARAQAVAQQEAEAQVQQEADARAQDEADARSRKAQEESGAYLEAKAQAQAPLEPETEQAPASPEPVQCPPDPPPPEPGRMYLPSVAFRAIPAGCVPAATPQPVQPFSAPSNRVMILVWTTYSEQEGIRIRSLLETKGYHNLTFTVKRAPYFMRIWIGPFSSRAEADAWRQRLVNEGFSPIVQP